MVETDLALLSRLIEADAAPPSRVPLSDYQCLMEEFIALLRERKPAQAAHTFGQHQSVIEKMMAVELQLKGQQKASAQLSEQNANLKAQLEGLLQLAQQRARQNDLLASQLRLAEEARSAAEAAVLSLKEGFHATVDEQNQTIGSLRRSLASTETLLRREEVRARVFEEQLSALLESRGNVRCFPQQPSADFEVGDTEIDFKEGLRVLSDKHQKAEKCWTDRHGEALAALAQGFLHVHSLKDGFTHLHSQAFDAAKTIGVQLCSRESAFSLVLLQRDGRLDLVDFPSKKARSLLCAERLESFRASALPCIFGLRGNSIVRYCLSRGEVEGSVEIPCEEILSDYSPLDGDKLALAFCSGMLHLVDMGAPASSWRKFLGNRTRISAFAPGGRGFACYAQRDVLAVVRAQSAEYSLLPLAGFAADAPLFAFGGERAFVYSPRRGVLCFDVSGRTPLLEAAIAVNEEPRLMVYSDRLDQLVLLFESGELLFHAARLAVRAG